MELLDTLPPRTTVGGRPPAHADKAELLRANPLRWAKIMTCHSATVAASQANNIRRGKLRAFTPSGTFEAAARDCDVYARYIPENQVGADAA
ncbi:hypothetical protein [Nocardia terpenica]|uniref:Uncharacterized protein n=1 Tax=Nocardia terpenica TaxID=455432 RepID=A0A164LDD6_9NOCA|nr:hypothetical protein [Nocardia terpenica]KZM72286.1 hypothetical protein AWN90_37050 [Nocardia terpenica]NQE86568.1 hypothetical protein [Nocardia terpenica]